MHLPCLRFVHKKWPPNIRWWAIIFPIFPFIHFSIECGVRHTQFRGVSWSRWFFWGRSGRSWQPSPSVSRSQTHLALGQLQWRLLNLYKVGPADGPHGTWRYLNMGLASFLWWCYTCWWHHHAGCQEWVVWSTRCQKVSQPKEVPKNHHKLGSAYILYILRATSKTVSFPRDLKRYCVWKAHVARNQDPSIWHQIVATWQSGEKWINEWEQNFDLIREGGYR